MTTLTSAEAVQQGYRIVQSETGLPRIVGPDGRVFARCAAGTEPDLVIGEHRLRHVMRIGAFLRMLKARRA